MKFEWKDKAFSFINHSGCEWFPCHRTDKPEDFNCLFCYCPLYALEDKCGGIFTFLEDGTKDCSACELPHKKENYALITDRLAELQALIRERRKEN